MRRRSDRKRVENHQLAISIPPAGEKSRLGLPAVRQRLTAGEHPLEVHATVDGVGVADHFGVVSEAAPYCEDACEEQCGVDGRQLALPRPLAGLEIDEVIEPAALLRHLLGKPAQRRFGAVDDARTRLPAACRGNAQPAQPEANGGDAADVGRVLVGGTAVGARPVANDPGANIRLLPEERKRPPRQILQKPIVCFAELVRRRRGRRPCGNARLRATDMNGDERDDYDTRLECSGHFLVDRISDLRRCNPAVRPRLWAATTERTAPGFDEAVH